MEKATATPVVDIEITRKPTDLAAPDGESAIVLFRLHGRPLGWGAGRVTEGRLDALGVVRQFLRHHSWSCALPLAERAVQAGRPVSMLDAMAHLQTPQLVSSVGPAVTVAVRNRTPAGQLQPCLDSLMQLEYAPVDLVLIDSSDDRRQVEALVHDHYPNVRYTPAPGSGAARCLMDECRGDILAVTDGDTVVDPRWVSAMVHVFLADPEVMEVSGFVLPRSLERPFRATLAAGAPFCRLWGRVGHDYDSVARTTEGALERTGANVAYWRPGRAASPRYTRVWEPAALVRTRAGGAAVESLAARSATRILDRRIDLVDTVSPIADASSYDGVRLHVTWNGELVGTARITHHGAAISRLWIEDAIAQQLTAPILDAGLRLGADGMRALLTADLIRYVLPRWQPVVRGSAVPSPVRPAA